MVIFDSEIVVVLNFLVSVNLLIDNDLVECLFKIIDNFEEVVSFVYYLEFFE